MNFLDLPPELIEKIMKNLDGFSLLACFDVSTYLRDVIVLSLASRFGDCHFLSSWRRDEVIHKCGNPSDNPFVLSLHEKRKLVLDVQLMVCTHKLVKGVRPGVLRRSLPFDITATLLSGNLLLVALRNGSVRACHIDTLEEFATELEDMDLRCEGNIVQMDPLNLSGKACLRVLSEEVHARHDSVVVTDEARNHHMLVLGQVEQRSPLLRMTKFHKKVTFHGYVTYTAGRLGSVDPRENIIRSNTSMGYGEIRTCANCVLYGRSGLLYAVTRNSPSFDLTYDRLQTSDTCSDAVRLTHYVYSAMVEVEDSGKIGSRQPRFMYEVSPSAELRVLRPGLLGNITKGSVTIHAGRRVQGSTNYDISVFHISHLHSMDSKATSFAVAGSVLFIGSELGSLFMFHVEEEDPQMKPKFLGKFDVTTTSSRSSRPLPVIRLAAGFDECCLYCIAFTRNEMVRFKWSPLEDFLNS